MDEHYILLFAEPEDIDGWMGLVNIVKDDFPGLVIDEYRNILVKNIARQTALCVKYQGEIIGVLLFSIRSECLSCMAVHPSHRKKGVGSAMVGKMISLFPPKTDICVMTFREDDRLGGAPRALYRKFGFTEGELTEEHGHPGQKFILHRS